MPATPLHTPERGLDPAWFDYNGHLNMAYYNVLFDNALDCLLDELGGGAAYREKANSSFFTAEAHVSYLRELKPGSKVHTDLRIVDFDAKRLHVFEELYSTEGFLSATTETLLLHVDMSGPKVSPMPDELLSTIKTMADIHRTLPRPEQLGRTIGIPARTGGV